MDGPPEKKAIVVIEDNEAIAELIKDLLNAEPDYQAVAVHDGALALDVIRSVKASLILLDLGLPGLDGLQVYDMIKADRATCEIPILFVTADPNNRDFRKREITDFIAKPFELDDLLARVAALLTEGRRQKAEGRS
jgi:DNA-binding response OmpR family regulator